MRSLLSLLGALFLCAACGDGPGRVDASTRDAGIDGAVADAGAVDAALADAAPIDAGEPDAGDFGALQVSLWNLCGNVCYRAAEGRVESRGEIAARVDAVVTMAAAGETDIVLLNEVCYSQYKGIQDALAPLGFASTYRSTTTGGQCDRFDDRYGSGFGVAIFSRGTLPDGVQEWYDLGDPVTAPSGVVRNVYMLCGLTELEGRPVKVCTAHLRAGAAAEDDAARARQLGRALERLEGWADEGLPVVFGGDLNMLPGDPALNAVYSHGVDRDGAPSTGIFREVDDADADYFIEACAGDRCRSGAPTFPGRGTKIDYIFVSDAAVRAITAEVEAAPTHDDAVRSRVTDHDLVRGVAQWAQPAEQR